MAGQSYRLTFTTLAAETFGVELARREDSGEGSPNLRTLVAAATDADSAECFRVEQSWPATLQAIRKNPTAPASLDALDELVGDLWTKMPSAIGSELQRLVGTDHRFVLEILGPLEITSLPWEALCVPRYSKKASKFVASPICERGQCSIVRRWADISSDCTAPLIANRTALLLVGSLHQDPAALHGERSIAAIANSMRRAGLRVTIAAGHADIAEPLGPGTRVDEVLHSPADLLKLLRQGGFTLLQYVGHSHAHDGADPQGAKALDLDIDGSTQPVSLADLALACREGKLRLANFAACDLREHAARTLLDAGGLEQLVTMGAIVPVTAAASFLAGFYQSLQTQHLVGVAVADGREAMLKDDFADTLAWVPQHHRRVDLDLALADDDTVRLERYCTGLLGVLDRFEGRFRRSLDPATLADVYVELSIDPQRAEQRSKIEISEEDQKKLANCTFADIAGLDHKLVLLGGKPGAGKSTSLRVHARRLAADSSRAFIPLFVNLPDWLRDGDDAKPLCEYVANEQAASDAARGEIARLLESRGQDGRLFVFFDGLDELSPKSRTTFERRLLALCGDCKQRGTWHTSRFLVSTRRYEHTLGLTGFLDLDIQELTPKRAVELLRKVLATQRPPREPHWVEEQCKTWLANFEGEVRAWQEIGKVPLFVTILGELLLAGRKAGTTRVEFFDEVFDHLLFDRHHGEVDHRNEVGRRAVITGTELEEREAQRDAILDVLGRIAWSMNTVPRLVAEAADLRAWCPAGDAALSERIAGSGLGKYISSFLLEIESRTSLFARDVRREDARVGERASLEGTWRFWHRSFQEALVGREIAARILANVTPSELVKQMRLAPTADEIKSWEQRLLDRWDKDDDARAADYSDVYLHDGKDHWNEISPHWDSAENRPLRSARPVFAQLRVPRVAGEVLQEFWIEALAGGVARVASCPEGEQGSLRLVADYLRQHHGALLRDSVGKPTAVHRGYLRSRSMRHDEAMRT
ncbi:MAG: CHAT domain-containing protein [Planctomycetota bacterium]